MITARLFKGLTAPLHPENSAHADPQKTAVKRAVLVHGIFEDGSAYDSLKKRLESHGIDCFVPQLRPANGTTGLDCLAENLRDNIEQYFGKDESFALIAFSMGGLISRHYLQVLGGADRCELFITISSPHRGTWAAYCLPFSGTRQMRPRSSFLKKLTETEHTLAKIPVISYRTPFDLIILPTSSSIWDRAENYSHRVILHPLMLHSRRVLNEVEKQIIRDRSAD